MTAVGVVSVCAVGLLAATVWRQVLLKELPDFIQMWREALADKGGG